MLQIDHVILGVSDLDAATRRMQALGLGVVDGGRHEGFRAGPAGPARVAIATDVGELLIA